MSRAAGNPGDAQPVTDRHMCPVAGCTARVPHHQLTCKPHWRKVPRDLQRRVYRAYREGTLADHAQACEAAVAAIEDRYPEDVTT